MRTHFVYLNGRIVPADEAHISPYDIGLLRGYAVFDLLRTSGGKPFLLDEHLRRFRASAAHLGLQVPVSDEELTDAVERLLELNEHEEATVRLVLTGGVSPDGMSFDAAAPTLLILTHDLHLPSDEVYLDGGTLLTCEHRRELPEAKTTNYITLLSNRERITHAGALDLLYHDGGRVFEAATASFYVVREGRIHTPDADVLAGTVGELVLRWASEHGYEIVYADLPLEQVFDADEAFLTSTTRGVVGIVGLDDRVIADGAVGPVTRALQEGFRALMTED